MARKPKNATSLWADACGTSRLVNVIWATSKLSPGELEEIFAIGSEGPNGKRSGNQWRRYARVPTEANLKGFRILSAEKRDRIARIAFNLGWFKNISLHDTPTDSSAFDSIKHILGLQHKGCEVTAKEVEEDRVQWLAAHQNRIYRQSVERRILRQKSIKLKKHLGEYMQFLFSIDGHGYDGWVCALNYLEIDVDDDGNTTISNAKDKLIDVLRNQHNFIDGVELGI